MSARNKKNFRIDRIYRPKFAAKGRIVSLYKKMSSTAAKMHPFQTKQRIKENYIFPYPPFLFKIVGGALIKTAKGVSLVFVYIENGQELGDREQVLDLLGQVQKL